MNNIHRQIGQRFRKRHCPTTHCISFTLGRSRVKILKMSNGSWVSRKLIICESLAIRSNILLRKIPIADWRTSEICLAERKAEK